MLLYSGSIVWAWSGRNGLFSCCPCPKTRRLQALRAWLAISTSHQKDYRETMPNPNYTQPQSSSTGWWFGTWFFFHSVGNFIIPTDELIFFRGVCQPPTSHVCYFNLLHSYWKWSVIIYNGHLPMYPFIIIINPYILKELTLFTSPL